MVYFISGHRDLTDIEFREHYKPIIDMVIDHDPIADFVVGDWEGCDTLTIAYLLDNLHFTGQIHVVCINEPRIKYYGDDLENYEQVVLHYKDSYDECDASMTENSDFDIAWIRPGRENSHTAKNIKRRYGLIEESTRT